MPVKAIYFEAGCLNEGSCEAIIFSENGKYEVKSAAGDCRILLNELKAKFGEPSKKYGQGWEFWDVVLIWE